MSVLKKIGAESLKYNSIRTGNKLNAVNSNLAAAAKHIFCQKYETGRRKHISTKDKFTFVR